MVATMSLATVTISQTVPSYVPTNGLVGWWPFNGNANDESGNGNNGTVNGATLTTDRFSNANAAFRFNGISSSITFPQLFIFNQSGDASLSIWINKSTLINSQGTYLYSTLSNVDANRFNFYFNNQNSRIDLDYRNPITLHQLNISNNFINNSWEHVIYTRIGNVYNLYINGQFVNSKTDASPNLPTAIGWVLGADPTSIMDFVGNLDDIGIWNRALTQQEITNLFNSKNCNNNLVITPQTNTLQIGKTAKFTATTSDANPSYVWQSDFGQGFQTLNNYGNYSGVNTATLNVANVKLANHNQAIRAISTSGNCADTSNVAFINIADTCVNTITNTVTITDTTFISVTDTLIIDIKTVGLNSNTVSNIIKAFPNPAHSHLNLNFGNYANLAGYSVKIINSLSQIIYNQAISKQTETIDLTTFGGSGIYYLHILNSQGKSIEVKKIVLE